MQTIQATVNPRLLAKANRLFTGTLQGRIIEILQNARRAGARKVEITNQDSHVTVKDDGNGIDDFSKLLDMGGSGWEAALEESEDPAGVGLFCLAPRTVTIRSNGRMVNIASDGWTGQPVEVQDDPNPCTGTCLSFHDEPWSRNQVERHAVFTGMEVLVDGEACPQLPFVSDQAADHPELGYKIQILETEALDEWRSATRYDGHWGDNVLVNFHGQVVPMQHHPVSEHRLLFMVALTGAPTGIRLMLPARTRLVENDAFNQLKAAMELEAYHYLQCRGHHRLPYKDWQRAQQLGINLPEADPVFSVGLLHPEDSPEPAEVTMPEGFPLVRCYRFDPDFQGGAETDEANVHLLAALGKFDEPFVPISIDRSYLEYSWARQVLTITKIQVQAGKRLQESWLWSGKLVCVDSLTIAVDTSDGRSWTSPVCMTIQLTVPEQPRTWCDQEVLVTPAAQERLEATTLWYHLGGYCEDGDKYDTQEAEFHKALDEFWARLVGPYEQIRRSLINELHNINDWKSVTLSANGRMSIRLEDGSRQIVKPTR